MSGTESRPFGSVLFFFRLSMTLVLSRSGELSLSDFADGVLGLDFFAGTGDRGAGDGDLSVPMMPVNMSITFSMVLILFSICN